MNVKVTLSVPLFLIRTKGFLEAIQKDFSANAKMFTGFNFDNQSLAESFAIQELAELAQVEYDNATKDEVEARAAFENQYGEATAIFQKHSAALKVALKDTPQKQLDLGLIGKLEGKTSFEWLTNTCQFYESLLDDPETIEELNKYHLKKHDLEDGQNAIISAHDAYEALTKGRAGIKLVIENRDKAVLELIDNISKIQALLLHVFEKDTKKLKDYNLPVVNDEIGQQIMITMVKDSSIT